jgi:hypothetical protein
VNSTKTRNSPRASARSNAKVKIDSAQFMAKQSQMQNDLRLDFETLTKRSNNLTVGTLNKSVETHGIRDSADHHNRDLVDI